jgi:hypothetical protein
MKYEMLGLPNVGCRVDIDQKCINVYTQGLVMLLIKIGYH